MSNRRTGPNRRTITWRKAKQEGIEAAWKGELPKDNPYRPSQRGCFTWWDLGWWEAENWIAIKEERPVRIIDGSRTLIGDNIARHRQFEKTGWNGGKNGT
jgi:hypothetical protein